MKPRRAPVLSVLALVAVVSLATLAVPRPAPARVKVRGGGSPVAVSVVSAPVGITAPPAVVYTTPVVMTLPSFIVLAAHRGERTAVDPSAKSTSKQRAEKQGSDTTMVIPVPGRGVLHPQRPHASRWQRWDASPAADLRRRSPGRPQLAAEAMTRLRQEWMRDGEKW